MHLAREKAEPDRILEEAETKYEKAKRKFAPVVSFRTTKAALDEIEAVNYIAILERAKQNLEDVKAQQVCFACNL